MNPENGKPRDLPEEAGDERQDAKDTAEDPSLMESREDASPSPDGAEAPSGAGADLPVPAGELPDATEESDAEAPGGPDASEENPSVASEGNPPAGAVAVVDTAGDAGGDVADDAAAGEDEEEDEGDGEGRMTLMEHLQELRKRLMYAALGLVAGFLICYPFAEQLFRILMEPMVEALTKVSNSSTVLPADFFIKFQQAVTQGLAGTDFPYMDQLPAFFGALQQSLVKVVMHQGQFIYTYPPEAFFAHVKVGAVAGFFLMSPFIFYQLWCFVAPGLYAHERRWIVPIAVISAVFFVTGGLFGYFIVFPFGFDFFASYTSDMISFTPKLSEYLGFSLRLLIAFGLIFELPIFIFFLARIGLVNHRMLRRYQKYAILVAFIVAAILTPPDPFTQMLMAGPLVILYEIGIWVAFVFGKRRKEPEKRDEDAGATGAA